MRLAKAVFSDDVEALCPVCGEGLLVTNTWEDCTYGTGGYLRHPEDMPCPVCGTTLEVTQTIITELQARQP